METNEEILYVLSELSFLKPQKWEVPALNCVVKKAQINEWK